MQPGSPGDAQLRKLIRQVEDLVATTQDAVAERMAALDAVAATAQDRIAASAADRLALHKQLDTLTATVATLAPAQTVAGLADQLTALASAVTSLTGRKLTAHAATAAVPAVALGSNTTVTITWPTPFPDAAYVCSEPVLSSALVGKVTGTITGQTAAGCTVKLSTGIAVALGSTVSVVAVRYA